MLCEEDLNSLIWDCLVFGLDSHLKVLSAMKIIYSRVTFFMNSLQNIGEHFNAMYELTLLENYKKNTEMKIDIENVDEEINGKKIDNLMENIEKQKKYENNNGNEIDIVENEKIYMERQLCDNGDDIEVAGINDPPPIREKLSTAKCFEGLQSWRDLLSRKELKIFKKSFKSLGSIKFSDNIGSIIYRFNLYQKRIFSIFKILYERMDDLERNLRIELGMNDEEFKKIFGADVKCWTQDYNL